MALPTRLENPRMRSKLIKDAPIHGETCYRVHSVEVTYYDQLANSRLARKPLIPAVSKLRRSA